MNEIKDEHIDVTISHTKKWTALGLSFIASWFAILLIAYPVLFLVSYFINEQLREGTFVRGVAIILIYLTPLVFIVYKFLSITKTDIVDMVVGNLQIKGSAEIIDIEYHYEDPISEKIKRAFLNAQEKLGLDSNVLLIRATDEIFNAFALSNMKNESAIVVFDGLVNKLDDDQLQAVIGHEMGHIINNDSSQKIAMFASQYYVPHAENLSNLLLNSAQSFASGLHPIIGIIAFFYILAIRMMIFIIKIGLKLLNFVNAFAYKQAEYLADYNGAKSSSSESMINALQTIQEIETQYENPNQSMLLKMLAEHPDTSERIEYLKELSR